MMVSITAVCSEKECPVGRGDHCRCVLITEAEEGEVGRICAQVESRFGCLFGRGLMEGCGCHIFRQFYPRDGTVRDREFECSGCSVHCRFAFDEREPWVLAPTIRCPRNVERYGVKKWKEIKG